MNRIMMLVLCFLVFQSAIFGAIPNAESVPFLGIENVAFNFKKSVFAVQINIGVDDWKSLGSGFISAGWTGKDKQDLLLGITCKHVVEAAEHFQKPIYVGMNTDFGYKRFKCVVISKDPNVDVAIFLILTEKEPNDPNRYIKFNDRLLITPDLFGDANSLVEGRSVIVAGFPLGLGVEVDKEYPVIRMGFVAQYTGKQIFLIDGIASPGNSGSPVFGIKSDKNQLLGMITSYRNDYIQLFDENHNPVARLPYNSGLAQAITADEIRKCIDKLR